jgi:hypothetical protein
MKIFKGKFRISKKNCKYCIHNIACKMTPIACKHFSELNKILDIFEKYQYYNIDSGVNFYE